MDLTMKMAIDATMEDAPTSDLPSILTIFMPNMKKFSTLM